MLAECICIRQAHMQKDLTTMRNFPTHRNNNVSLHLVCINISQRDPHMFKLISSFSRQNKTPNSNLNIKEIKYTVENKVTEPDKMFRIMQNPSNNHMNSYLLPHPLKKFTKASSLTNTSYIDGRLERNEQTKMSTDHFYIHDLVVVK